MTVESECHQLEVVDNQVVSRREDNLCSNHEEADTKMFVCCQHATLPDRNVNIYVSQRLTVMLQILAVYYKERIQCNLYVEIGTKEKKRILAIVKIHASLGEGMSSALLALHAVSGCDSTSAFFGVGKQKAYKIVKSSN